MRDVLSEIPEIVAKLSDMACVKQNRAAFHSLPDARHEFRAITAYLRQVPEAVSQ